MEQQSKKKETTNLKENKNKYVGGLKGPGGKSDVTIL